MLLTALLVLLVCNRPIHAQPAAIESAEQTAKDDDKAKDASETSEVPKAPLDYMGRRIARTMHYEGAPWLVRESRERQEECSKLLVALQVEPGQTVCDLGCGNGFYTLKLAKMVGPKGIVWAVDIQPEMLRLLEERADTRGATNIEPKLGGATSPNLPADEIDLLLLVDVYHEFSHPEQMLEAIRASLKPNGRVALVEYRAEDETVPIRPLHKMSQVQVMKEYTGNGFKLVGQFDDLPWQHVFFFARDDSSLEEVELEPWRKAEAPEPGPANGKKTKPDGSAP